jgi:hypothetical protein
MATSLRGRETTPATGGAPRKYPPGGGQHPAKTPGQAWRDARDGPTRDLISRQPGPHQSRLGARCRRMAGPPTTSPAATFFVPTDAAVVPWGGCGPGLGWMSPCWSRLGVAGVGSPTPPLGFVRLCGCACFFVLGAPPWGCPPSCWRRCRRHSLLIASVQGPAAARLQGAALPTRGRERTSQKRPRTPTPPKDATDVPATQHGAPPDMALSAGGSCSDLRRNVHLHHRLRCSLRPCPRLLLLGRKLHGAEDGGRHVEGPWGGIWSPPRNPASNGSRSSRDTETLPVVPRCRWRPSGDTGLQADFRDPFHVGWLASAHFFAVSACRGRLLAPGLLVADRGQPWHWLWQGCLSRRS